MAQLGTATLSFGAAPGSSVATVAVTGQSGILSTNSVEAYLMGVDSTADHNAYEHGMVPMTLRVTEITDGVGFVIQGSSEWLLTGDWVVRWVWA